MHKMTKTPHLSTKPFHQAADEFYVLQLVSVSDFSLKVSFDKWINFLHDKNLTSYHHFQVKT